MSKITTDKHTKAEPSRKPRWLATPRSRLRTAIFTAVLFLLVLLNAAFHQFLKHDQLTIVVFAWSSLLTTYLVLGHLLPSDRKPGPAQRERSA